MRAEITRHLRCPVCAEGLTTAGAALRCARGHSFDVARQGYVNLVAGRAPAGGDTAEMVAARADILAAGHLDVVVDAVVTAAVGARQRYQEGFVLDVGAGTGHHLAAVLDHLPGHLGLALDVAKPAVRRAATAHPRAGAAVVDAWRGLPVADRSTDLLLNVFAPRNGPEFARVLRPDGVLVVVTPGEDHLGELVGTLGLLGVDPRKEERLAVTLGGRFRQISSTGYRRQLSLATADARRLVAMGPSAWHTDPAAVAGRLAALGEPVGVTAAVRVGVYRLSG